MAGRSPARFLAPLALVVFALALFIVVSNATKDDSGGGSEQTNQPAGATATPKPGNKNSEGTKKKKAPKTYTVKTGDTPSGIAEKVGIPLEELLQLNPDVDPQALAPGTELKLR
jgi:LysM repeat protein